MVSMTELERRIDDTFQRVLRATAPQHRALNPSIVDIDLEREGNGLMARPEVTELEVLAHWRDLIETMKKYEIFLGYLDLLERAFSAVGKVQPPTFRHCRTLLHLMKHTAENSDQDASSECRFVTLAEIMASYGPGWVPSSTVEAFWVRLMQRIPAKMPPINFRRKAYRVLVSLSWVPSSKGLLAACSFEEKTMFDPSKAAPCVQGHFRRVRPGAIPLPRHDSVNQILDRLKDETDVCVGITSELDGVGKTTLAALVASHPSILQVFKVVWLSMTNEWHTDMDYETYTKHLTNLCAQLDITMQWPVCEKRFEEPALRRIREANFMQAARARMSERIQCLDQNVLLVLDDVTQSEQLELFRFNERQSVIVTATDPKLRGLDWEIRLDVLSLDEALEVFLTEVALPPNHAAGWTKEVEMLIHYCDYHPLTVRTLGRWCRMKAVSAGLTSAIQELASEMGPLATNAWDRVEQRAAKARQKATVNSSPAEGGSDLSTSDDEEDDDDQSTLLFDVLSLMMGPDRRDGNGTSVIFVLCFAAMVVVFPERVPLDVVLLLWEQLFRDEPLLQEELSGSGKMELKRRAWYVAEGLFHLGIVSIMDDENSQAWIESHHEAYSDFAMIMAKSLDLGETFEETCEGWHKAFVTVYFNQRISSDGSQSDEDTNSWEYAVEKLPDHIFRANMLSMAETILTDENFFQARLDSMGWQRAIEVHIRDCVQLQQRLEESLESSMDTLTLSAVFTRTAAMVSRFAEGKSVTSNSATVVQVSRALYDIGLALAEHGYFEDAMVQFEAAQSFAPESESLRASILYASSWVLLASGEISEGLQEVRACRHAMESCSEQHPLYKEALQLYADALIEECDYVGALETLIRVEQELLKDVESNWIELGSILKKKGRLLHTAGRLDEATAAYELSVQWKQHIGENSQGLAATYSSLGDVKMETKKLSEAKQHYENALQCLKALNCSPKHINFTLTSGKLRYLMGDYQASLAFLAKARHSINVAPLLVMDQSAYDLRCIAQIYEARGDIETASETLGESLVLTSHRPGSLERAVSLIHLGNCYRQQFKQEEAIKCFQQSLDIQIARVPESAQIVETITKLGKSYFLNQDYDRALEKYEDAYALSLRIFPSDTARLAEIFFGKGEALEEKGVLDAARHHYTESVSLLKRGGSRDHLGIAKAMHAIGRLTAVGRNERDAIPLFQEAARIRRMHFSYGTLVESLHCLGILYRNLGDLEEAEKSFREALKVRQRDCNNKALIGEAMLVLGDCFFAQDKDDAALQMYEECLDFVSESETLRGFVYIAMGKLKGCMTDDEEALELFRHGREIMTALYDETDTRLSRASLYLGVAHFLANNFGGAISLLQAYVKVCGSLDKNDMNFSDAKQMTEQLILAQIILGDALVNEDHSEEGIEMWTLASDLCEGDSDLGADIVDMVVNRLRHPFDEKVKLEIEEEKCIRRYIFHVAEPNY